MTTVTYVCEKCGFEQTLDITNEQFLNTSKDRIDETGDIPVITSKCNACFIEDFFAEINLFANEYDDEPYVEAN